jgi:GNAT superfamily N-acetyltransferase
MKDVKLTESIGGYAIIHEGEQVGSIEGVPGFLEYLVIRPRWIGEGFARAAVREFAEFSYQEGQDKLEATNTTHDAMEHILETEGFEETEDGVGLIRDLDKYLGDIHQ